MLEHITGVQHTLQYQCTTITENVKIPTEKETSTGKKTSTGKDTDMTHKRSQKQKDNKNTLQEGNIHKTENENNNYLQSCTMAAMLL